MKTRVFLTVAIMLAGLSTNATSGVALHQHDGIVIGVEGEYIEIKTSELPKAILDALAADFNTATLNKAYVNAKQEYKLHITVQEVTSAVHYDKVYADKNGNWIDKGEFFIPVSNTRQEITKQTIDNK